MHVLLVEDNEGDILLTTEALKESKIAAKITVAKDGLEAITFLDKQVKIDNGKLPDLILLDVNMPRINGYEVLDYIREHKQLEHLPVIMLSTTIDIDHEQTLSIKGRNTANCYLTKPWCVTEFFQLAKTIKEFCLNIITSPRLQF